MKTYNNISAEQAGIVLTSTKKAMPNRCSVLPQEILSKLHIYVVFKATVQKFYRPLLAERVVTQTL